MAAIEYELDAVTTDERASAAVARLEELHPYDTASTIVRTVTAGDQFAAWVHGQTTT